MSSALAFPKILLLSSSSQEASAAASCLCSERALVAALVQSGVDLRLLRLNASQSDDCNDLLSFRDAMGTCRELNLPSEQMVRELPSYHDAGLPCYELRENSVQAINDALGDWRPKALLPLPLSMPADISPDSEAMCLALDYAAQTGGDLPMLSLADAFLKRAFACAMLSDLTDAEESSGGFLIRPAQPQLVAAAPIAPPAQALAEETLQVYDFFAPPAIAEDSIFLEDFAVEPIKHLRVGFIGMGRRAGYLQRLLVDFDDLDIVALCDLKEHCAEEAADALVSYGRLRPAIYARGALDYLRMLEEEELDAVFVTAGWQWHADICCAAMNAGVHAFVEVPLAMSLRDLWRVVDCAERTKRHCMMLENACYGRDELMFLNMVQQGVIGEPIHAEAGYIHDLRFTLLDEQRGESRWRLPYYMRHNGNLYPTHGIGPVSRYMGLVHGADQFSHLVSMSSRSVGFSRFTKKNFPPEHEWNQQSFECGDVNTSLIATTKGNTIMLQWDECSLRPYTRHNLIQGEKGILAQFPTRVIAECLGVNMHDDWICDEQSLAPIYEKYDHPLWRQFGARAEELAGSRARDYLMLRQIVHALQAGLPMDQSVYEGATWSSISELTERSVAAGGAPIAFPDFTRGRA